MNKLLSESDVKNALQIESFRNLSKEKIMEFLSLIPNMDKDIALNIINQFPTYVELTKNIMDQLEKMCDSALASNQESHNESILAYKKILDELGILLQKDNISQEERTNIYKNMIIVADKISEKDTEQKHFINQMTKYKVSIASGVLLLGAVILGVNVKGVQLPRLNNKS